MRAAVASSRDVASGVLNARLSCPRDALGRRSPRRARRRVSPVRVIEKKPSVLYDFSSENPLVSPDAWMETLRDATPRKGGTARCDPSARPGAGVRAVRQFWRRGDVSSYDRAAVDGVRETSSSSGGSAGTSEHPVLAALARRLRDGTAPGSRAASDTMKIGLVVEGGGMKGVVSAGACGELLRLGMYDCFDAVYGSSAGAMNLTYYLAKQPEGVAAYQEDLVDGSFLDLKRLPKTKRSRRLMGTRRGRRPAMDVSYLVDGVMDGVTGRALRWSDVLTSPLAFNVVATSLDTLTPVILHSPFQDTADLKAALKASAAVPLFAGPEPVRHRGQRLVDAAVMEPVPVHAAAADGCTHVLVLLTRVLGDAGGDAETLVGRPDTQKKKKKKKKRSLVSRALGPLAYKTLRGALMSPRHMRDAWRTHDATRALTRDGAATALDDALLRALRFPHEPSEFPYAPAVFSVAPDPESLPKKGVSSLCVDPATLQAANAAGAEAARAALGRLRRDAGGRAERRRGPGAGRVRARDRATRMNGVPRDDA